MKKYSLKKYLLVCLTLFSGVYSAGLSCHDLFGKTLGQPFYATDVYHVTCTTDSGGASDYLETSIIDTTQTTGGGKISAVTKGGGVVEQTGDPGRNDGNYSPPLLVHGGNGLYEVFVHKLNKGPKIYSLQYHCKSSGGAHTGTEIITIQNQ
ncbi:MAG: hypothetical protein ACRERV_03645 [Methylococcales bacterium]